jgi:hypothetical protein
MPFSVFFLFYCHIRACHDTAHFDERNVVIPRRGADRSSVVSRAICEISVNKPPRQERVNDKPKDEGQHKEHRQKLYIPANNQTTSGVRHIKRKIVTLNNNIAKIMLPKTLRIFFAAM